jgi:hypothetical protein
VLLVCAPDTSADHDRIKNSQPSSIWTPARIDLPQDKNATTSLVDNLIRSGHREHPQRGRRRTGEDLCSLRIQRIDRRILRRHCSTEASHANREPRHKNILSSMKNIPVDDQFVHRNHPDGLGKI